MITIALCVSLLACIAAIVHLRRKVEDLENKPGRFEAGVVSKAKAYDALMAERSVRNLLEQFFTIAVDGNTHAVSIVWKPNFQEKAADGRLYAIQPDRKDSIPAVYHRRLEELKDQEPSPPVVITIEQMKELAAKAKAEAAASKEVETDNGLQS